MTLSDAASEALTRWLDSVAPDAEPVSEADATKLRVGVGGGVMVAVTESDGTSDAVELAAWTVADMEDDLLKVRERLAVPLGVTEGDEDTDGDAVSDLDPVTDADDDVDTEYVGEPERLLDGVPADALVDTLTDPVAADADADADPVRVVDRESEAEGDEVCVLEAVTEVDPEAVSDGLAVFVVEPDADTDGDAVAAEREAVPEPVRDVVPAETDTETEPVALAVGGGVTVRVGGSVADTERVVEALGVKVRDGVGGGESDSDGDLVGGGEADADLVIDTLGVSVGGLQSM